MSYVTTHELRHRAWELLPLTWATSLTWASSLKWAAVWHGRTSLTYRYFIDLIYLHWHELRHWHATSLTWATSAAWELSHWHDVALRHWHEDYVIDMSYVIDLSYFIGMSVSYVIGMSYVTDMSSTSWNELGNRQSQVLTFTNKGAS